MKDLLYAVLGLGFIGVAIWQFITFIGQPKNNVNYTPVIIAGICAVVALVFGALFMSNRVNRTEDIHITE